VGIATARTITGVSVVGGLGNDSLALTLASGGQANSQGQTAGRVFSFDGGDGADVIGLIGGTGSRFGLSVAGGEGADLITGTFATGAGFATAGTVNAGSGADTISFLYTAAATAGAITLGNSGLIVAGSGADSITVVANALSGGNFRFGSIRGGSGNDTITFGGQLGTEGDIGVYSGSINAGAGADSIIFSGNNTISGGIGRFQGNFGDNSAAFVIASGDSLVSNFDTIFISNNDVTGGQTNLAGTFGSAGWLFTGFNSTVAGNFSMGIQGETLSGGGVARTAGQAIFTGTNARIERGNSEIGILAGGVVGYQSGGGARTQSIGTYQISGESTLGQIFSSVDALAVGRGTTVVFNVQNGTAGTIDGYLFTQGGVLEDTIVKLEGRGVTAALGAGVYYFSAGAANGLASSTTFGTSGGAVYFGANVGFG